MNEHIREYQGRSRVVYTVTYDPKSEDAEKMYWKVYIRTPTQGFSEVEAKSAAIDCGAPNDRSLTTHALWRRVWFGETA